MIVLDDLTAAQLRELEAGDPLTFPPSESCPMEVGDIIVLEQTSGNAYTEEEVAHGAVASAVSAPTLWIEVTELRRTRKLAWRVVYRRYDFRPLWLKGGPPRPEGSRLRQRTWTDAEEHGLTVRLGDALDCEAEVVDGHYMNVIEIGARLKAAERRDEKAAEEDLRRVQAEVRELAKRAQKMGVDPLHALAPVAKAIREAQDELTGEAA